MSELITASTCIDGFRLRLHTSVCAAVLLTALAPACASEEQKTVLWIELGGAFSQQNVSEDSYLPPFINAPATVPFVTVSPLEIEKGSPTIWDVNGKLTLKPADSNWSLSLGAVYGRSIRKNDLTQRTTHRTADYGGVGYAAYQKTTAKPDDSHLIVDFQVGKDVGLGIFGANSRSQLGFGIRYAQLNSKTSVSILYHPTNSLNGHYFSGALQVDRKFAGIGPLVSWDSSIALSGGIEEGLSFDWGAKAAILFGRQRAHGSHRTSEDAVAIHTFTPQGPVYQTSASINRSRTVAVPNLGGFAGISWRYPNAKINLGYRADFFFGAIDGGIDTRKNYDRNFFGPFATIGIGLGG